MSLLQRLLTIWLSLVLLVGSSLAAASEYVTYLHPDIQGSPVLATDEQGQVIWRESYAPWGQREVKDTASANPALGGKTWYTGKEEEASLGLYYYGARWYSADVGQFYSVDPAPVTLDDPRSFGRYHYANNNPIRHTDPDGRSPIDVGFLAYDVARFGVAVYSGVGVGAAAVDVGMSIVGVLSPVPGAGQMLKAARTADRVADAARAGSKVTSAPKYARNKYKPVTGTEKKRVLGENPTCVYCEKKPSTTVDHIRSQKQDWDEGGWADSREVRSARVNDPANLTGACSSCNPSKGSKPIGDGDGEWIPPKDR